MDLDQAIDQSYRDASEAENVARRLEARIEQIPGAKGLLPSRKYGTPVNFKAIQENLTLASLISRSDAALAHYCGLDASVKHRIDEQREAQKMRAGVDLQAFVLSGPVQSFSGRRVPFPSCRGFQWFL